MQVARNQFGVPQYPDGDARRLFILLSAVDLLERPTISAIADLTGMDHATIDQDMMKLREQFGVVVHKVGDLYHIDSWGDVLKKRGVTRYLKNGN